MTDHTAPRNTIQQNRNCQVHVGVVNAVYSLYLMMCQPSAKMTECQVTELT